VSFTLLVGGGESSRAAACPHPGAGVTVGPPPTSGEEVALLEHVVAQSGEVPLLLSMDSGPEGL